MQVTGISDILKLLKPESSHILISYIELVTKNHHQFTFNTFLIKALLSFSLSPHHSLEPVVFKLQCASDSPTEPVKIFKGPASTPEILIQ